jgi:hypothetical protein
MSTQDEIGIPTPYECTITIEWRQGSATTGLDDHAFVRPDFVKPIRSALLGTSQDQNFAPSKEKVNPDDRALSVGPAYPNLIENGVSTRTSRHAHLQSKSLIGSGFPIRQYPRLGDFTHRELASMDRPYIITRRGYLIDLPLGGDRMNYKH